MCPVQLLKVCELFLNLQENKVDIPNKLIKIVGKSLSIPFTYIYNESIRTGVIPDILKISRITPIFKNGISTDPYNYRPISTLGLRARVLISTGV